MKTHFRKKFKRRGSILVMSVFFLLILFITASAFLTLLPVENRAFPSATEVAGSAGEQRRGGRRPPRQIHRPSSGRTPQM